MIGVLTGVAIAYLAAGAGLFWAMRRGPATFGAVMQRLPLAALALFPFRTMLAAACGGRLQPGDPAPDFELPRLDGKGSVRLSALRGKPVLLVFGSYT